MKTELNPGVAMARPLPKAARALPRMICSIAPSSIKAMHETMNNQCFELTPLSRWYVQRHIVSLLRWNTYAMHIALI